MDPAITAGIYVDAKSLIGLGAKGQKVPLDFTVGARSILAGAHVSRFRGRGMDFAESREYLPGDDVRHIDWRVTARTGKTHTKLFVEERERPVFAVVDFSRSMFFGSKGGFKSVTAAKAAAMAAWSVIANGDRIGGVLGTYGEIVNLKPLSGRRGVLRILNALANATHFSQELLQDFSAEPLLNDALNHACQVVHPGSMVIVFSDFSHHNDETRRSLSRLTRHNDVVACQILDPLESRIPVAGQYLISDGKEKIALGLESRRGRNRFESFMTQQQNEIKGLFSKLNIPQARLINGESTTDQMLMHFGGDDAYRRRRKKL